MSCTTVLLGGAVCLGDVPLGDRKTTYPWGLGNVTWARYPL